MAASRFAATLTQLTATATTALAGTGCAVFRGPVVTGDPGTALFIGFDGDPMGDFQSVLQSSEWAGLGAKARNEMFDVMCSLTAIFGDGDVASATNNVHTLFTTFEAAMRADPSLNQAPRFTAEVNNAQLFTTPHPTGLQVRLAFNVRVSARI